MKKFVDYYAVLGVAPGAPVGSIRESYYGIAKATHDSGNFGEGFAAVTEAWGVIKDPARRAAFDRERRLRGGLCKMCNGAGLRVAGMRGETKSCGPCKGTGALK